MANTTLLAIIVLLICLALIPTLAAISRKRRANRLALIRAVAAHPAGKGRVL